MKSSLFVIIISFLCIQLLVESHSRDISKLVPQLSPPKHLSKFTFGYHESVADSLWLRAIQNLDYCRSSETVATGDVESESPSNAVSSANLLDRIAESNPTSSCELGWVYKMLDRVTDLSPRFHIVYTIGASTLSILVDDDKGAARIYEKGLRAFPNDWRLAYRAAYHELFELHNFEKAANLLYLAGQNGAPIWVQNLASKLYERAGQVLLGRTVLQDMLKKVEGNSELEKRTRERLKHLDELWTQELIKQSGKTQ